MLVAMVATVSVLALQIRNNESTLKRHFYEQPDTSTSLSVLIVSRIRMLIFGEIQKKLVFRVDSNNNMFNILKAVRHLLLNC